MRRDTSSNLSNSKHFSNTLEYVYQTETLIMHLSMLGDNYQPITRKNALENSLPMKISVYGLWRNPGQLYEELLLFVGRDHLLTSHAVVVSKQVSQGVELSCDAIVCKLGESHSS